MSKPIILSVAVIVSLLAFAACEPREEAPPREARTTGVDDDELTLAPPCPIDVCLQCEHQATGPSVMRTWAHELRVPGAVRGPPTGGRPSFLPLSRGGNDRSPVGVAILADWDDSATLRLSYAGCGVAPGTQVRVARWAPGGQWAVMTEPVRVNHDSAFVEVEITSNSRYAIATE